MQTPPPPQTRLHVVLFLRSPVVYPSARVPDSLSLSLSCPSVRSPFLQSSPLYCTQLDSVPRRFPTRDASLLSRKHSSTHTTDVETAAARVGTALLGRVVGSVARAARFVRFRPPSTTFGLARFQSLPPTAAAATTTTTTKTTKTTKTTMRMTMTMRTTSPGTNNNTN